MLKKALLLLTLSLSGCAGLTSSPQYPRHPLAQEILKPRMGFQGLTNRACDPDAQGKCTWKVEDHLLTDPETRKLLNDLHFVCKIGKKRFKVCLDQPGFCRREFYRTCFLGICGARHLKAETIIPAVPYQRLLDAGLRCYSLDYYPEDLSSGTN